MSDDLLPPGFFEIHPYVVAQISTLENFSPPPDAVRVVARRIPDTSQSVVKVARRLHAFLDRSWYPALRELQLHYNPSFAQCETRVVLDVDAQEFMPRVSGTFRSTYHVHYEYEDADGNFLGPATLYCFCGLDNT